MPDDMLTALSHPGNYYGMHRQLNVVVPPTTLTSPHDFTSYKNATTSAARQALFRPINNTSRIMYLFKMLPMQPANAEGFILSGSLG